MLILDSDNELSGYQWGWTKRFSLCWEPDEFFRREVRDKDSDMSTELKDSDRKAGDTSHLHMICTKISAMCCRILILFLLEGQQPVTTIRTLYFPGN
uniref:Uncharacterized protein n=1 Tax=Rhizophora mucronata TaxID=61149 RepID=A0A2P2ISW8_RHIMU